MTRTRLGLAGLGLGLGIGLGTLGLGLGSQDLRLATRSIVERQSLAHCTRDGTLNTLSGPDPLEQRKRLPPAAAADGPRVGAMFLLMRGARHDCPLNMACLPLSGLGQERRAATVSAVWKHHLATFIRL